MVARIDPSEVAQRLASAPEAIFLLDVREDEERDLARIEPSVHIPMAEVAGRLAEVPHDREIVVYCHLGARSEMVAAFLEGEGYAHVANLSGGIDAWSVDVDPGVPRYS